MGERLGPYILDRRIGSGGMADVFLARGPKGVCVVKRPHPHLCANPDFVRMFLNEASLLAQLHHPGIAQIFDLGSVGESYYLAMEYVPGFDLMSISLEHERQGELMSPEVCARIVADAAVALHYAHEAKGQDGQPLNLVHRDISPHNILLSTAGQVKLIDFGVAKASRAAPRTQAGLVKGKYPYMAPEQVTGQAVDRRVDVYALGLVLYELLTNVRAIAGDTEVEQIDNARSSRIRPVEQLRPNITDPMRLILGSCLHPDPNGRYPTALHVVEDLEKFLVYENRSVGREDLLRLFRVVDADAQHSLDYSAERPPPKVAPPSDDTLVPEREPTPGGRGLGAAESLDLGSARTEPSVRKVVAPNPSVPTPTLPDHDLGTVLDLDRVLRSEAENTSLGGAPLVSPVPAPAPAPVPVPVPVPVPHRTAQPQPTWADSRAAALVGEETLRVPPSRAPLALGAAVGVIALVGALALWFGDGSSSAGVSADAGALVGASATAVGVVRDLTPVAVGPSEPSPQEGSDAAVLDDDGAATTPDLAPSADLRAALVPVDCEPVGELYVDGKPSGSCPRQLELAAGKHLLTLVSRKHFLVKNVSLQLAPGERKPVVLRLQKGVLQVTASPFAELRLNGSVVAPGVTFKELELYEGTYLLEAVLSDPSLPKPIKKSVRLELRAGELQQQTLNMLQ